MSNIPFGDVGILQIGNARYGFRPMEIYTEYGHAPILRGEFMPDVFEASNLRAKAVEYLAGMTKVARDPEIKKVIFSDPATVVIWNDGTKTVVKCQPGDTYSKETGLALCIAKKYLGNKGNFNEVFKKWIPEETEPIEEDAFTFEEYDEPIEEDVVTGVVNLKRSGDIKVGDTVLVINPGQHYSSYSDWVELHVTDPGDAEKWGPKHDRYLKGGDIGIVKYIAPHEWTREGDLFYVEIEGYCYIIGYEGLEKVEEA